MAVDIDVLVNKDNGYYDISFGEDGDFDKTQGLDTSLVLTFFTNQRADASEITQPINRGGWWGNLFFDDGTEIGSKLWLLQNSRVNQNTLNTAIDFANKAYQYLLDLDYADSLNVSGAATTSKITLTIQVIINSNISQTSLTLWTNTNEL
jgi:phage gp46-like protein